MRIALYPEPGSDKHKIGYLRAFTGFVNGIKSKTAQAGSIISL